MKSFIEKSLEIEGLYLDHQYSQVEVKSLNFWFHHSTGKDDRRLLYPSIIF